MKTQLQPDQWISNHSDYLYRYTRTRIFNQEDALDFVQDTFYAAWQARASFKGDSSERTWLVSILKRKIIDYYRRKSVRNEVLADSACQDNGYFKNSGFMEGHWNKERAPKESSYEENNLEMQEFHKIINKCLSMLPALMAACFTLKTMEDLSTEEVCKELNISASNLWTSMHRAKLQLRDCMELNGFGRN